MIDCFSRAQELLHVLVQSPVWSRIKTAQVQETGKAICVVKEATSSKLDSTILDADSTIK